MDLTSGRKRSAATVSAAAVLIDQAFGKRVSSSHSDILVAAYIEAAGPAENDA